MKLQPLSISVRKASLRLLRLTLRFDRRQTDGSVSREAGFTQLSNEIKGFLFDQFSRDRSSPFSLQVRSMTKKREASTVRRATNNPHSDVNSSRSPSFTAKHCPKSLFVVVLTLLMSLFILSAFVLPGVLLYLLTPRLCK